MKRLAVVLSAVLVMLLSSAPVLAAGEAVFKDEGAAPWARPYVVAAGLEGLLKGYPDGTFRPGDPLKREEMVAALVRFAGLPGPSPGEVDLPYADSGRIPAWARGAVEAAFRAGMLPEEEFFRPGEPADRLWAAEVLLRAVGMGAEAELRAGEGVGFGDAARVAPGKLGYLAVAVERGLLEGFPDGTFRPDEGLTRAQLAALLARVSPWREWLSEREVRGLVSEVSPGEEPVVVLRVAGSDGVRRYPVSPDALVLVGGRAAPLAEVDPGLEARLLLNPSGVAVVVSAWPVASRPVVVLRGWLVNMPDLEDAAVYGLVPAFWWSEVRPLLGGSVRSADDAELRPRLEPLVRRVPVVLVAYRGEGGDGVIDRLDGLLGEFVEVRAARVRGLAFRGRPAYEVLGVLAAEPPAVPQEPGSPGPSGGGA